MKQLNNIAIKPILIKILIVIAILLLGLLASCITIEKVKSRKFAAEMARFHQEVLANYKAQVAQNSDAYYLTKTGLRQLEINLPDLALISLKHATEIKTDYRDAHLALGIAQFQTGDFTAALTSFQQAEKLDPIYAKTYEFLKITYEKLEDSAGAQKASEKHEYLSRK